MSVLRRYNRYQGLKDLDVLINDDAPISQYFNIVEVPDIITQGRSSFLIGGSPLLKHNVELKFEIINDASGKVIYTEPVANYLEGTSRRVSIEVYDDPDTFGDATMYVVGELNPNEVEVPSEWLDVYNVRWYSKIYISGTGVNTEPILFYKQPSMWVGEIVKGFVETTYPTGSVTQSTGTVTGDPLTGTEGTQPEVEDPAPIELIQKGYKSKVFGGGGKNAGVSTRGRNVRRASPEVEKFTINMEGSDADVRHVGAIFTVNNPKAASSFVTESYHEFPEKFETTIKDVKNSSTLIPTKEFVIKDTRYPVDDERHEVIVPLAETAYTMSFQPAPTHSVSTVNFRSFADIRISKLRTFSGDIHGVKVYSKNKDAFGDFELIADTPIESPELLFDTFGSAGSRRIGYFENQNTINTYWESGSNATLTHDSTYILDSIYISGSNNPENSILRFQSTGSLAITFYKDIEYSIRAKIIGKKGPKTVSGETKSYAELGIFLSGSSFESNQSYGSSFGYQLVSPGESDPGLLTIDSSNSSLLDFGIVEEVFQPLRDGTGILQFGAPAGSWYIADVSITPVSDTGFSPDWIRVVAPVPPLSQERPDDYEFISEFYDINNNVAGTIVHVSASTFQGANEYIAGTDNLLSGSLYIGSTIGGGIEMAGVGSGFIRSIGYLGFTSGSAGTGGAGFMLWSGSALSTTTDEYDGVGLELFGSSTSYMRYRTNPSELDIRADTFFVGNPASQFISGSGNQIEISSSNFHVQPDGDVLMTGTITATAGNIGDWQIIDGKLSGSNATLDAVGAALYHTTKGPGSDTSATFDQLRDEYYIDFTPSEGDTATAGKYYVKFGPNFSVSQSGVLFASGAVFEGTITASAGLIGGANIESASLTYSPYWRISASANTTDPASFISSSRFKVSAGGNITGSQVLFTGGKIAGFDISGTKLQQGTSFHLDGDSSATYFISSSDFQVTPSGDVSGSQVLFTGGKIAGWDIDEDEIKKGTDISLDSTNKKITINSSTFGASGIQLDYNTGEPQFYVGDGSNDYLKYVHGDGVDIKTAVFKLDTDNLDINSAVNSGYISLGPTPNTSVDGTNAGVYMDGTGDFLAYGNATNYIKFEVGGSPVLNIKASTFDLLTSTQHISSSGGGVIAMGPTIPTTLTDAGVFLSGSGEFNFRVDSNNYIRQVGDTFDIKSNTFNLATSTVSMSSANNGKIAMGATPPTAYNSGNGIYMDGSGNLLIGSASAHHIQYNADINEFDVQVGSLELAASNIQISSTQASMSLGGVPGSAANITIDGQSSNIRVGSGSNRVVTIQGGNNDNYIAFGGKTDFGQTTTAGFIMGTDNATASIDFTVGDGNDNYIRADHTGVAIKTPVFDLDTDTLDISSTSKNIRIFESGGSPEIIRLGEISEAAGDEYGLKIYDGTGNYSDGGGFPGVIAMFGEQGNKIAGWELTGNQIRSIPAAGMGEQFATGEVGLILQASGSIETSDFVTGLKGWRISSLGNGTAEFENARIRGTLRTTVFEKESVNVVGGQLMVANSTTLEALKDVSGSIVAGIPSMSITDTTMSVANTSGFRSGEILKTKKINSTGFSVEYMLITGSLRYSAVGSPYSESIRLADMGATDPDGLAGELYVGRGLGQSVSTGSVVGTLTIAMDEHATTMSVSTGEGYAKQSILKLDDERMKVVSHSIGGGITVLRDFHDTVSASHAQTTNVHVIDTDKEFLAGLVSTPETYNEGQVFVSTGVYAPADDVSSGYILMNANPNDISTPYMDIVERTGSGVYDMQLRTRIGDLSGLSSAYLYGNEEPGFGIYTENGFFKGALHAMTGSIHGILHVATLAGGIETGAKISIGRNVSGTQDGIYINNNNYWFTDAEWKVGDSTNYLHLSGSGGNLANDLRIKLEKFELNAGSGDLKISSTSTSMSLANGKILLDASSGGMMSVGSLTSLATNTINRGIYASGSGAILIKATSTVDQDYLLFNSSGLTIKTTDLDLLTSTQHISSSNGGVIAMGTTIPTELDDTGIFLSGSGHFNLQSDSNNYIRQSGDGLKIQANAGFQLSSTSGNSDLLLTPTKFLLDDSATAAASVTRTTGTGIYMDNTGAFRAGVGGGNRIDFDGTSTVNIQSDNFTLDATTLYMDSDTPSIRLHASDASELSYGGTGVYMDGAGKFSAGSSSGYGIFWDGTSTLQLSSSEFYLGDATNYISGSGGAINIGADTFDLKTTYMRVSSSAGGTIAMGSTVPTDLRETGVFLSGSGDFNLQADASSFLRKTGDIFELETKRFELTTTDLQLSSTQASMSLGEGKLIIQGIVDPAEPTESIAYILLRSGSTSEVILKADNKDSFIGMGGKTSFAQEGSASAGILIGMDSDNPQAEFVFGLQDYFIFDRGLDIATKHFELKTIDLEISSQEASMSFGSPRALILSGNAGGVIKIGEDNANLELRTGSGIFLSGSGEFKMGDASGSITYQSGSGFSIHSRDLSISASGFTLSSPEASMSLGNSQEILFDADGGTGGVPIFKLSGGEISASNFFVDVGGNLTASNARIDGILSSSEANIGGWTVDANTIYKGVTRLSSSAEPGLYIEDKYGAPMVLIASKSMFELGSAFDESINKSFEITASGEHTDGYHLGWGNKGVPPLGQPLTVHSWSFSQKGPISHSITKRTTDAVFGGFNAAVLGDFTFDVVHPGQFAPIASLSRSYGEASSSYLTGSFTGDVYSGDIAVNSYELTQIVSASDDPDNLWKRGNVVSFAGVAKMSHSFAGVGLDRGLQKQKYKVDYWTGTEWTTFIPKSGSTSDLEGFAHYSLGTRYTSIAGAGALPVDSNKLRITLTGSINPDTSYVRTQYLYEGAALDPMFSLPANTPPISEIVVLNTEVAAKYPYTEITFDSFRIRQSQPRIELSPDGFLLYSSDSSYLKMTPDGIDLRGGQGFSQTSTMIAGESLSDNTSVFGSFAGPSLQAYEGDTADVSTTGFAGNVNEFSMGNHIHDLPFSTLDSVAGEGTFTSITATTFVNPAGGIVSASAFSSPSQGTVRATINGVQTDVDTGLQIADSPRFAGINVGHASDTTITKASSGDINIEGNLIYRAGGTDVPVADGGTGASTFTQNGVLIGNAANAITAVNLSTNGAIVIGDGSGNPTTLNVGSSTGITILDTIATGVWEGDSISTTYTDADNYSSWTLEGDGETASTVSSGETVTVAGTAPISTVQGSKTVTISVDNDGITDTHLAYNTGQHLTTTSNVNFGTISGSDIYGSGLYVSSSGHTNVIQVGATGAGGIQKWEWHRDGIRKWLIYNEGRTNQDQPQDAMVFKHGVSADGDDHINFHLEQDDQTVYFHGDISGSGDFLGKSTSTGSFGYLNVDGNIGLDEYIHHNGDDNTYIQFGIDQIDFVVGGQNMIYLNEGGAGHQEDQVVINQNLSDVDFHVKGDNTENLFRTDALNDRVAIGFGTFGGEGDISSSLHIGGDLTVGSGSSVGHITASGNIVPSSDAGGDLGASNLEWKDLFIDGTAYLDSADIDGGTIDGSTIATSDITVGSGKTLDVSGGTLTLAANQISGDEVEGGTIAATTITALTSTSASISSIGAFTAGGAINFDNQNMTNVDIDSGAVDGTNITVGTGKTLDVSGGTLTLAANQISGDKVEGGTIAATTITALTSTSASISSLGAFTAGGAINFDNQNMTNVDIDSGTITGITDLVVADGGTGVSTITGMLKGNGASDFTGQTSTAGHVAYWSDANTITGEDYLDVTRGGTGLATVGTDYILTGNTTSALTAESALTFDGSVLTINNTVVGSTTFISGFTGGGWKIDDGITVSGKTSATFDNLTIRGTMSVYELLINQVRATNGNLFISSTGKVSGSVTHNSGVSYTVDFDTADNSGHGFAVGDVIRMQRFDNAGTGGSVTISDLTVAAVANTGSLTANLIGGTVAPQEGFEYVRLGNTSTAGRQGGIYLTADDSNAPFIDVFDNITSHADWNSNTDGSANTSAGGPGTKVRIGKLDGVTSARFGALPNDSYGLWASGSVYLEGGINAKFGNIGTWAISETAISSSDGIINLDAAAKRITISDDTRARIYLGEVDGNSTYGMKIFDGTGVLDADLLVELGEGGNIISGWEISGSRIHKYNSTMGGGLILDSDNLRYDVYSGSANYDGTLVRMGQIASNKFGILGNDTSGNLLFKLGEDGNEIAGWSITTDAISKTQISLNATIPSLRVSDGSTERIRVGDLKDVGGYTSTDTNYGIIGFQAGGIAASDVMFELSNQRNVIAGWTIGLTSISKGKTKITAASNASSFAIQDTVGVDKPGIFIGQTTDANTYQMSLSGSAGRMLWDNTALKIRGRDGTEVFTTTATGATIGGWTIDTTSLYSGTKSTGTYTAAGALTISSSGEFYANKFKITKSGDATFIGDIAGATGTFAAGIAGTGYTLNDSLIDLTTTEMHISSSNNGVIAIGATAPTSIGDTGVLMFGSGQFSFVSASSGIPSAFIKVDSSGFSIRGTDNNFAVDTAGNMAAKNATIEGNIRANAGFFGSSGSGWIIQGDTLTDFSESIILDANPEDPSINIVSGSYTGTLQRGFTDKSTILSTGGYVYDYGPNAAFSDDGNGELNDETVGGSGGSQGSGTTFYTFATGSASGSVAFHTSTQPTTYAADLTVNKKYRTTVVFHQKITLDLQHSGEMMGTTAVTGNAEIWMYNGSHFKMKSVTMASTWFWDHINYQQRSVSVTINHNTDPSTVERWYAKCNNWRVSSNWATETYTAGIKEWTVPASVDETEVWTSKISHEPANKALEITPKGMQGVVLQDASLESVLQTDGIYNNQYFRLDPSSEFGLDVLGDAVITGSMHFKERGSTDNVSITPGTNFSDISAEWYNCQDDGGIAFTNGGQAAHEAIKAVTAGVADGIAFYAQNGHRFQMGDTAHSGNFSATNDIIGFSSTPSDIKFKENVIPINNSLGKVLQLRGVEFDWKGSYKDKGHDLGFIAQEVENVKGLDPLVKEQLILRTGKSGKTVRYEKVVPLLVEAIKEQQRQIDELTKKIEEL